MDQSKLKALLHYDPETGIFTWRSKRPGVRPSLIAGCKSKNGYVIIGIDGKEYYAHRLAWIYMNGQIPNGSNVDHTNGSRQDNRIANLRLETQSCNFAKSIIHARTAPLTSAGLREVLVYDETTGFLFWKDCGSRRDKMQRADRACGNEGYLGIRLNGKTIRSHRAAWIYVNGHIPEGMDIDHINRNRKDNRIENLRICTRRLNCQNTTLPRKNNSTGFLGVSYQKCCGKYVASIGHKGKRKTIGRFNTAEDASAAYWEAKRRLHEFCPPTCK